MTYQTIFQATIAVLSLILIGYIAEKTLTGFFNLLSKVAVFQALKRFIFGILVTLNLTVILIALIGAYYGFQLAQAQAAPAPYSSAPQWDALSRGFMSKI